MVCTSDGSVCGVGGIIDIKLAKLAREAHVYCKPSKKTEFVNGMATLQNKK